ncbi:MAG: hypothetical protein KDE27_03735, partial [Planctomycetes bacterium]|nr:hypothetical protein [Planctomycetota bacterium]
MSAAATDTGTETGTGTEPDEPLPRALWPVRCLAVGYVGLGVWLMLAAAPRVPYADPYRFLARFLTLPFPASVVAPDNGHREVLPNLVRWAEARWLDADQWLQLAVGTTLVLLAFAAILRALRRAPRAARTAAAAIVCVGLFWLGNWRKLVHHNESVSFGFVLLWLALGLTALGRGTRGGAVTAGLMGVLATMSFGSGPACFAAFLLVLLLQRAPFGRWLPVLVGAVAAAALLLTAGGEAPRAIGLAPGTQLVDLLHWLGAPFVWALNPLLDAAHAARLPEPFATV